MSYFSPGYFSPGYFSPGYFVGGVEGEAPTGVLHVETAVDQPPYSGRAYPFIQPKSGEHFYLNDFWLSYSDDKKLFNAPFRIAWLYGFGVTVNSPVGDRPTPVHAREVLVLDADDQVVFDSTLADVYDSRKWGLNLLRIVEWRSATAVCRCSMPIGFPVDLFESDPRTLHFEPLRGVLDPRAYSRRPRSLLGLRVNSVLLDDKRIKLLEGYNVSLTTEVGAETDGARRLSTIEIAAVPGLGLGRFPGCEDDTPKLRTINGVGPDAQHRFTIDADGCLRIGQPTRQLDSSSPPTVEAYHEDLDEEAATHALQINNDCASSCCSCDMYHNTYLALSTIWDRGRTAGERADTIRERLEGFRSRWLDRKTCSEEHTIQAILRNEPGKKFSIAAGYCNKTAACLSPFELKFDFTIYDRGDEIESLGELCGVPLIEARSTGGEQRYTLLGTWPSLSAVFDRLDGFDNAQVKFRFCIPGATATMKVAVKIVAFTADPEPDEDGVTWTLPVFPAEGTTDRGPARAVETFLANVDVTPPSSQACAC